MPEDERVAAFIDRVVAGARIPSRAARDDLRRELWTHFEEAGTSADAVREAMRRFGAEAMITESLRRVYGRDVLLLYLAKIAASLIASAVAALLIEVLVNVRVERRADVWRLAPGFSHAAPLAIATVLALVTMWEAGRPPFNRSRAAAAIGAYAAVCGLVHLLFAGSIGAFVTATILAGLSYVSSKSPTRTAKLLLTFAVFAAVEYGMHLRLGVAFGPSRALAAGAVLVVVWASTMVILTRLDQAFVNIFETV